MSASLSEPSTRPPRTRRARKAATRETLRQAAREAIAERGFAAVTVGDIAARAGVAHGTFYVHFAGKEAVLDDLLAETNQELAARLAPLVAAAAPGAATMPLGQAIGIAADAFLDHFARHRDLVAAYAERLAGALTLAQLRDGINPPLAGLLDVALASRAATVPHAERELAALGLLAMWLRVGLQHLFNPRVRRATARRVLVEMTEGALAALVAGGPDDHPDPHPADPDGPADPDAPHPRTHRAR